MMDGAAQQFATHESGKYILWKLYGKTPEFICHIMVPTSDGDSMPIELLLETLGEAPHVFEMTNKDRVYDTSGRFTRAGDRFNVNVTIHYAKRSQAMVTLSSEAINALQENRY